MSQDSYHDFLFCVHVFTDVFRMCEYQFRMLLTQSAIRCSKLAKETLEEGVKHVQS